MVYFLRTRRNTVNDQLEVGERHRTITYILGTRADAMQPSA